ncbi:MAG: type I restriction endonuclease [Nostoc sp.]|uniref:type I restriction endonuclease n=1 Tax=Nostoc sp. TaxID=1180 RepID=UPI002FFD279B
MTLLLKLLLLLWLVGINVEYQTSEIIVYDQVQLIDFTNPDNNDWLVVNQFTVIENKKDRRPDVVVFINGLPLGVANMD